MSGFEHYERELLNLDHEILHYASVCGVNLANSHEMAACLRDYHDNWSDDKARESLHGLLLLRLKVETEMIEQGLTPPSIILPGKD